MSTSPYRSPGGKSGRREAAGDGLYIVGLTGGISSGKTTVGDLLVSRGARRVSADEIGHDLLRDPGVRSELTAAFGREILTPDGGVDRKILGQLAFATSDSLEKLNAISHPRLVDRLRRSLAELIDEGFRGVVLLEAALLVEWDLGGWCDEVVTVTAPEELRIERATEQHRLSREQARQRIQRQLPDRDRVRYSDREIVNDGSREDLEARTLDLSDSLWKAWRDGNRSGSPSRRNY